MKILILTQYFPPETGAPQNRLFSLAKNLAEEGDEVTVLTAMPNYPRMVVHEEYRGKWYVREMLDGIEVYRSWVYVTKSKGIVSRLMNYFSFVKTSAIVGTVTLKKYDYILCESPPLFLGFTAIWLSMIKRAKLIFNVSDLWPESAERLGLITNRKLLGMATWLEQLCYKRSFVVSGQTKGIVKNISERFPAKPVYWLRNGVDLQDFDLSKTETNIWRRENGFSDDDFILLYAGIVGYAQGLEVILHCADKLKDHNTIHFILLGEGPEKKGLQQLKNEMKLDNVHFFDGVPKNKMPEVLSSVNATVIPLKKLELFKGAIPSKIFESLAMKKPVLLGVEGEANELFIDHGNAGLGFEPENHNDLAEKVISLYGSPENQKKFGESGYEYVKSKFNRSVIAREFRDFLLNQ